MRLENKIAIITGGAGGMGQAAAILFAREGAKVAVVDLDEGAAAVTVDLIAKEGGTAIAIGADVTRSEDLRRMVDRTVSELGLPNVLFNNAGVDTEEKKLLTDISEEAFDRAIAVNLKGVWLVMKHVVPRMIEAGGGSIVNTASVAAFISSNTIGYSGAQAGVVSMTRVAAVQLAEDNIRVNVLCPGATLVPTTLRISKEPAANDQVYDDSVVQKVSLLGRVAQPEEMAKMALFLASDDSSYATGASFINDGGWTAKRSFNGAVPPARSS